jgi:hypothetical protein
MLVRLHLSSCLGTVGLKAARSLVRAPAPASHGSMNAVDETTASARRSARGVPQAGLASGSFRCLFAAVVR